LFGLGLGLTYSLFIVSRFREELALGAVWIDGQWLSQLPRRASRHLLRFDCLDGCWDWSSSVSTCCGSVGMGGVLVVLFAVLAAIHAAACCPGYYWEAYQALPVRVPVYGSAIDEGSRTNALSRAAWFWYQLVQIVIPLSQYESCLLSFYY